MHVTNLYFILFIFRSPVVAALPQIRAIQANQPPQKFVIVTQNSPQQSQAKVVRRGSSPHSVVLSSSSANGANASNSNSSSSGSLGGGSGSGSGVSSGVGGASSLLSTSRSNDNVCSSPGYLPTP